MLKETVEAATKDGIGSGGARRACKRPALSSKLPFYQLLRGRLPYPDLQEFVADVNACFDGSYRCVQWPHVIAPVPRPQRLLSRLDFPVWPPDTCHQFTLSSP